MEKPPMKSPIENVPTTTTTIHTPTILEKTTKKCIVCGREFTSRNKLFAHLKESECGTTTAISASGKNGKEGNKTGQGDIVGDVNAGGSHHKPQLAKGNEAYYEYYLQQKICNSNNNNNNDDEQDWAEAYRRLRTPLPVTYRIHESSTMGSEFTARLLSLIEKSTTTKSNVLEEGNANTANNATTTPGVHEGNENEKVFRHWSFDDDTTTTTTTTSTANSANNNTTINDVEDEEGNVRLPKLRMTITPNCHRRNKSSSGDNDDVDVYSPILHALQELGAIHRQELVSAIPPLVLWTANSKQKGDYNNNGKHGSDAMIIADMCAAPGSKSLQLLDMLYYTSTPRTSANNTTGKASGIPSGLLVVNDSDRHRIVTLCQRSRRVPRAPMLAINMDARYFPGMRRRCKPASSTTATANIIANSKSNARNNTANINIDNNKTNNNKNIKTVTNNKTNPLEKAGYKQKYDMVLCDVPCTGDGTARKNTKVFSQWSIAHGMSLHRLQRKILRRAMELLRPGGAVVYSTCSLNPVENESVIASAIEDAGGVDAMEIVPLNESLAKKCRPMRGLSEWKVPHPKYGKNENYTMYDVFDDVPLEHQGGMGDTTDNGEDGILKTQKKKKKGGQINRSMFPPKQNSELVRQLGNCGRFLPSEKLDSGGFFVACIRRLKVGELGSRRKEMGAVKDSATASKKKTLDEKEAAVVPTASSIGKPGRDESKNNGDGKSQVSDTAALPTTSIGKPGEDESNEDSEESTNMPATTIRNTNEQSLPLREGDWICTLCGKINFGRRGVGSRCFGCKARRHHSATRTTEDNNNRLVVQVRQRPLLVRPKASVLESFLEFFGIDTSSGSSSFPLEHTRVIRRAKAKEHMIVVVSDALSKLAISESWGPVRELGVTLAAFPREEERDDGAGSNTTFRLLDEGISILARCATRRHFQLKPLDFVNAVAQSVRLGCSILAGGSTAESERVKATLDKSSADADALGDKDTMWYDSLEEESMSSVWEACKASPGYFIVSCECEIPASSSSLEGGDATTGRFSFCGCVDDGGNVEVKTSLRVMAAMLVVLHRYSEVVLLSSGDDDDAPVTKRRRL